MTTAQKIRKPDGLFPGMRCAIEAQGIRTTGVLVSGVQGAGYFVTLDGTHQGITVPGDWLHHLQEDER